ncbi:hypothetical protein [Dyella jiangningensis]|uniref:Glycosyltransferase RgtA/B/C/D-like domain-containing protein n=1 Tax=Dyella jiangningensis TaxID=1379159 RepID=A0A328P6R3_9GAMM|nr:hypothetical protein [Dyella jiangningensis]RAO76981.1 hypothetical protein CA260_03475 [Dyella jiangningensis]
MILDNPNSIVATSSVKRSLLWPVGLLAIGFGLVILRQSDYFRSMPGDLLDGRFNNLILEHLYRWVVGLDPKLWSPGFFYPYEGTLAFSDNHFGTGLVYIAMRMLGLTPEQAFIGWFTVAPALNFTACYYTLRRMGGTVRGSAIGAFIFTFSFVVSAQVGHAQLSYRFAVPLAMLAWQRFIEQGHGRHFALATLWLTVEFYCSIYLGYFLLLLIIGYFLAQALLRKDQGPWRPLASLLGDVRKLILGQTVGSVLTIVACAVALLALFYPYLHYSHLFGFHRDYSEVSTMLPRVASYALSDQSLLWSRFTTRIHSVPMRWEHQMFFGGSAIVLTIIGMARQPGRRNLAMFGAIAFLVALTLSVHNHSLYTFVYHLPLANAVRAVTRIGMVMLFPLAVLAMSGYDWLALSPDRQAIKATAAALLTILMIVEYAAYNTPKVPLVEANQRIESLLARTPPSLAPDAILFVPIRTDERPFLTEDDGMRLAQLMNRVTLNGYSGNWPVGYVERDTDPCTVVNNRLMGYAAFAGLDYQAYVALVKRTVVVGSDVRCSPLPTLLGRTRFVGKLPEDLIKGLVPSIDRITPEKGKLHVRLTLRNNSRELLPSVSDDDHPVRFSWRFSPTRAPLPSGAGWDTRKDVSGDVKPGQSQEFDLLIEPPAAPGEYQLEVNLVQETVAWFHPLGMPIATGSQIITTQADGAVRVEP